MTVCSLRGCMYGLYTPIQVISSTLVCHGHCRVLTWASMSQLLDAVAYRTRSTDDVIQGGPKKVSLRSLHITSSNTGRFSKFFHCRILQEICNKVIIKYSTSPQTCRYTTLWNIYVRKLVNQWNLSHHFVSQNWNITTICKIPDNFAGKTISISFSAQTVHHSAARKL